MKKIKVKGKRLYIVILILVAIISSIAGVYAERMIASNTVSYSNGSSGLASTNVQGALDELYVKAKCLSATTFAESLKFCIAASATVMLDDGTADHNMRYMGATPNNYVTFNGELWRVIGVFNNVDNGTGTKETRVKIIKADSIGNKKWHTSSVNIWKSAQLNADLQALEYASNSMVENAVWHLGDPGSYYNYTAAQAYTYERGTTVASGNDPTWTGKVGLMYQSDYGFASSGCKDGAQILFNYSNATCKNSDWLFWVSSEWLLSPISSHTTNARFVYSNGYVGTNDASITGAVRPAVYLKSSVTCKNCSNSNAGTEENPFILG